MIDTITYRAFLFGLLTLLFSSKGQDQSAIQLRSINSTTQYEAGTSIELKILRKGTEQTWPMLISSSYGKVVLVPEVSSDTLVYKVPMAITQKRGFVNWTLLNAESDLKGSFKILSTGKVAAIETYLGPPSIVAGGRDFSM